MIEMIRNLGVTAANLGETNQFTTGGQANEGVALSTGGVWVPLALGPLERSSSRIDGNTWGGHYAFPISAIGRVEVLKDGAAAVYGSDAIAGVANFITRSDFQGLEIGGSFKDIDNSMVIGINAIFGTGETPIGLSRRNTVKEANCRYAKEIGPCANRC